MTARRATDADRSAAWGRTVAGALPRRPMTGGVAGGAGAGQPALQRRGRSRGGEAGRPAAEAKAASAGAAAEPAAPVAGEGLAAAVGRARPGARGTERLRGGARG